MFGYQLLSSIPKERLFQLFVDGAFHKIENGWKPFEQREPKCMEAFFNAFEFAIHLHNQKLDSQSILKLHELATGSVENMNFTLNEIIRDNHITLFDISRNKMTTRGVAELISTTREKKAVPYPIKLIDRKTGLDLLLDETRDIKKIANIYQYDSLRYYAPSQSKTKMLQAIDDSLHHYYEQIAMAYTYEDKIKAIVQCVKSLELLHPFFDGNGRVFVNILLNHLLLENNFPPATFYDPNVFDLYAVDELVDIVKEAMKQTVFTIEHPRTSLFGYSIESMSNEEKEALDNITNHFRTTLAKHLSSQLTTNKESRKYLKTLKIFLNETGSKKSRIYSDCALGDVSAIEAFLKLNPRIAYIAKEYSSTLYRGLTLAHVAARTNQLEILKKIILSDPLAIVAADARGRIPIMYAIEENHAEVVDFLLKQAISHDVMALFSMKDIKGYCAVQYVTIYSNPIVFEKFKKVYEDYYKSFGYKKILQDVIKAGNVRLIDHYVNQFGYDDFFKENWLKIAITLIKKQEVEKLDKLIGHCKDKCDDWGAAFLELLSECIMQNDICLLRCLFNFADAGLTYRLLTAILVLTYVKKQEIYNQPIAFSDPLLQFLLAQAKNDNNGCVENSVSLSLLHFALVNNAYNTAKDLINQDNLNEMTARKFPPAIGRVTPLMLAVILGKVWFVELLLDHGADVAIKNECNESALSMLDKMPEDQQLKDKIKSLLLNAPTTVKMLGHAGLFAQPPISSTIFVPVANKCAMPK